jgi:hypothetical protein
MKHKDTLKLMVSTVTNCSKEVKGEEGIETVKGS